MVEIEKYIQNLLFLHDCVILPGFGGFVANYRPAKIDESQQMIHPPSKDWGFNRNLVQNDGLLINHLSESENISYPEAEKMLLFFVENIRKSLQNEEKFVFADIGCFFYDPLHNLQFEPAKNRNYFVDSFGLTNFELKNLNQNIPSIIARNGKTTKFFTWKRVWHSAAAVALLISVSSLSVNAPKGAFLNVASLGFSTEKKEVKPRTVQCKPCKISPPEDFVQYRPEIEKPIKPRIENQDRFYVIAGSFANENNAKKLHQEFLKKNYPSVIIRYGKFHSVAVNRFNTKKAAVELKQNLLASRPNSSYWILKSK